MANEISYWGLRPVRHINGSSWNGLTERCYIAAAYETALYVGDPVAVVTGVDATAFHTSINLAGLTDGEVIYGVITSFESTIDMNDRWVKKPASVEAYANVCTDPTVVYHIRDDGTVDPPLYTWAFCNAEMSAGTSSAITGLSGIGILGTSVVANDQSLPLIIIRRADLPDNALSINAIWEVMINTCQLLNGGAGNALGIAKV